MLTTHDIGNLFQSMRTAYGNLWKHGPEALPVWREALKHYESQDVHKAANEALKHHVEYPPSLPQFMRIIRESTPRLPVNGTTYDNLAKVERVLSYTKPESKTNPKGNPHGITLPPSVAERQPGESADQYEVRIANEVTFAMYPKQREKFQRA